MRTKGPCWSSLIVIVLTVLFFTQKKLLMVFPFHLLTSSACIEELICNSDAEVLSWSPEHFVLFALDQYD